MPSMLALLLKNLVGSKLPGRGILGVSCVTGQRCSCMSMPAGRAREEGALGPCCTLLAGGSMDRWFGSFLETADPPVLPPCPRHAIPHLSRLNISLQHCHRHGEWDQHMSPATAHSLCLPAAIPQIPVRMWVPIREWHLGSRSSLCKLGCPQASKGPSNVWSGSAEIQVPTNHSIILLPWAFT